MSAAGLRDRVAAAAARLPRPHLPRWRASGRRSRVRQAVWGLVASVALVGALFGFVFPTRTYLAQRAAADQARERLEVLTAGLAPAQLHTRPTPDEWSANEVLAHLRACADVWGDCIVAMLAHDAPTLRAVNPKTWIRKTDYLEQDFQPSFHAFATQRSELLAVLEPLAREGWSRAAMVSGAGLKLPAR